MSQKGPRSRDYNVSVKEPWKITKLNTNVVTNSGNPISGSGSLTVVNPWRPVRPIGYSPTNRTLQAISSREAKGIRVFGSGTETYREEGVLTGHVSSLANSWDSLNETVIKERLRSEAILSALAALKDQRWNAGVMLAEQSGLARMTSDIAKTVTSLRAKLRKGDFKGAYNEWVKRNSKRKDFESYPSWRRKHWDDVKHVKSVRRAQHIPQGWLYYHFALKPTINDLDGAHNEFVNRHRNNPATWGANVKGFAKLTDKNVTLRVDSRYNAVTTTNRLRSMRVTIPVRPKPGFAGRLSTLGVTNPAEAVYNGLPFSWVLDYVTTMGDWLAALDVGVGWQLGDWTESYRDLRHGTELPREGNGVKLFLGKAATYRRKNLKREAKTGMYGPMGSILPTLKLKGPSIKQLSNVLSVMATGFKVRIHP